MRSTRTQRRLRPGLVAAVVVLMLAGGVSAYGLLRDPGNVSHPNLEFTAPSPITTAVAPRRTVPPDTFQWPRYGFDAARTRFLPNSGALNPPFRRGWTYTGRALLEFPPVIRKARLYVLDDDGVVSALDKHTGKLLWRRRVGTLAAASPAVANHALLMPLLSTTPHPGQNPGNGRFVAISTHDGHTLWSRPVPAGSESSPLVWNNTVYYGDGAGNVRALDVDTGRQLWSFTASGPVKGGPALAEGYLYFGDYAGRAYALNARTGEKVWATTTSGGHFGIGSGNFYATPAVAFGRVYMGNTDGRVYSFAAHTGALAWATGTGAYVYSSAAVADVPRLGPTVYVGSYDGTFYAFDARSGAVRWSHRAGGRISGSSTIIGDVVYFSDLGHKSTTGLDVRTGHPVFTFPEGAFTPVVADRAAVYLVGYGDLIEMIPRHAH